MPNKVTIDWAGSLLHSTSEARALGVKPAPFSVRTSPPDTLWHRVITVPTPVPDTGVVLHVAPLDDDVTVADSVGVAAAAIVEVPMSAPPEMRAKRPTADNALVSLICDTAPPRLPTSRQRRAARDAGRVSIQYSTPSRSVKSSKLAICRCFGCCSIVRRPD